MPMPITHRCVFITAVPCVFMFITAGPIIKLYSTYYRCVFITAVPITKLFAWGGGLDG